MIDDFTTSIVTKADLTSEQRLCLSMVVLAIQDLNAESQFKELKKYYVVPKTKKAKRGVVLGALDYVFKEDERSYGEFGFCFCCSQIQLNPEAIRDKILKHLRSDECDTQVKEYLKEWRNQQ